MPNWCSNSLVVTGSADDVAAFVTAVRPRPGSDAATPRDGQDAVTALSLESIVPIPHELEFDAGYNLTPQEQEERIAKYGAVDGYRFRVSRWGTKWDCDAELVQFDAAGVSCAWYTFDSAWSPPTAAIAAASQQHPKLTVHLTWSEPGCDAAASLVYIGGREVVDLGLESNCAALEVVIDASGTPLGVMSPYQGWVAWDVPDVVDAAGAVRRVLEDETAQAPWAQVVVSCWAGDLATAEGALTRLAEDLDGGVEVAVVSGAVDKEGSGNVVLVRAALNVEARARVLIERGGAPQWFEALWDEWTAVKHWLLPALVADAAALVTIAPGKVLAAAISVVTDTDPADCAPVADEVLATGLDEAAAVKLLDAMVAGGQEPPPADQIATAIIGALTNTPTD